MMNIYLVKESPIIDTTCAALDNHNFLRYYKSSGEQILWNSFVNRMTVDDLLESQTLLQVTVV